MTNVSATQNDELIRKSDALKAVDMWESDWVSTDCAIRALPAVTVGVSDREAKEVAWLKAALAIKCGGDIKEAVASAQAEIAALEPVTAPDRRRIERAIDAAHLGAEP